MNLSIHWSLMKRFMNERGERGIQHGLGREENETDGHEHVKSETQGSFVIVGVMLALLASMTGFRCRSHPCWVGQKRGGVMKWFDSLVQHPQEFQL